MSEDLHDSSSSGGNQLQLVYAHTLRESWDRCESDQICSLTLLVVYLLSVLIIPYFTLHLLVDFLRRRYPRICSNSSMPRMMRIPSLCGALLFVTGHSLLCLATTPILASIALLMVDAVSNVFMLMAFDILRRWWMVLYGNIFAFKFLYLLCFLQAINLFGCDVMLLAFDECWIRGIYLSGQTLTLLLLQVLIWSNELQYSKIKHQSRALGINKLETPEKQEASDMVHLQWRTLIQASTFLTLVSVVPAGFLIYRYLGEKKNDLLFFDNGQGQDKSFVDLGFLSIQGACFLLVMWYVWIPSDEIGFVLCGCKRLRKLITRLNWQQAGAAQGMQGAMHGSYTNAASVPYAPYVPGRSNHLLNDSLGQTEPLIRADYSTEQSSQFQWEHRPDHVTPHYPAYPPRPKQHIPELLFQSYSGQLGRNSPIRYNGPSISPGRYGQSPSPGINWQNNASGLNNANLQVGKNIRTEQVMYPQVYPQIASAGRSAPRKSREASVSPVQQTTPSSGDSGTSTPKSYLNPDTPFVVPPPSARTPRPNLT